MGKWLGVILVIILTAGLFYLNLKPFLADIHYRRALELKKSIYYDRAAEELYFAISWDPNYALYHKTLGELYNTMAIFRKDKELRELAIKKFIKAIQLNPNDGFSYASLGWAYYYGGDYPNAETAFKASIERDPNNAYFHLNLGLLYKKLNKLSEAKIELEKVLAIFPNEPRAKRVLEEMSR
jgi:tetratricopeptide (TPR) repeat protein